jgi:hypothetical protein
MIAFYYILIVSLKKVALWLSGIYEKNGGTFDIFSPYEVVYFLILLVFPVFYFMVAYLSNYRQHLIEIIAVSAGPFLLILILLFL